MRSNRWLGVGVLVAAAVVAGCGGSAATSDPCDGGSGTEPSAGAPAPAASVDTGGTGGGTTGGAAEDAANVGEQLKPPNSTEVVRTTTDTYWYVTYESSDSPETLKGFYESQIPKTGLQIISTTSSNGSYVWAIARDESGAFGGGVTVAPSGNGSGSGVIVAVGSN
jgi:hypothetical protein